MADRDKDKKDKDKDKDRDKDKGGGGGAGGQGSGQGATGTPPPGFPLPPPGAPIVSAGGSPGPPGGTPAPPGGGGVGEQQPSTQPTPPTLGVDDNAIADALGQYSLGNITWRDALSRMIAAGMPEYEARLAANQQHAIDELAKQRSQPTPVATTASAFAKPPPSSKYVQASNPASFIHDMWQNMYDGGRSGFALSKRELTTINGIKYIDTKGPVK